MYTYSIKSMKINDMNIIPYIQYGIQSGWRSVGIYGDIVSLTVYKHEHNDTIYVTTVDDKEVDFWYWIDKQIKKLRMLGEDIARIGVNIEHDNKHIEIMPGYTVIYPEDTCDVLNMLNSGKYCNITIKRKDLVKSMRELVIDIEG